MEKNGPVQPLELSATSAHELINLIQSLHPPAYGMSICFRGQTQRRPLVSSARRDLQDEKSARKSLVIEAIWADLVSEWLFDEGVVEARRTLIGMGVLQHYGYRSHFVDISSRLEVAVWFATHRYVGETIGIQVPPPDPELAHAPVHHAVAYVPRAHYELTTDPGHLYVFCIPSDSPDLIDFRATAPISATRIHRQSAAGLLDKDGTSPEKYLTAVIRIPPDLVLDTSLSLRTLFPPPHEDSVYAKLIGVPCVVKDEDSRPHAAMAFPRLQCPLYADSDSEVIRALEFYRVIISDYFSPALPAPFDGTAVVLPFTRSSKSRVSVHPGSVVTTQAGGASNDLPTKVTPEMLSSWPSRRVCLLLPAHLGVRYCDSKKGYPLLRALAVEVTDDLNAWAIDTAWEFYDGVRRGIPGSFKWREHGWIVRREGNDDLAIAHASLGLLFLELTYHLARREAFLTRLVDADGRTTFNYNWDHAGWIEALGDRWEPSQREK